jgi:hypothetical protein
MHTINPLSTFYRHPDVLSSILYWLNIQQRISLFRSSKELQGIIFNETKDLDWKVRKSKYSVYSADLKSSLKQIKHFEQQINLPNIQNASIPSAVLDLGFWSGESLHIEPLPWDSNTVLAFSAKKIQVVHFGVNRCTVREHSFAFTINTVSFNRYAKEIAVLVGLKITFFSCDANGIIKELRDMTIQTSKPSRGLGRGLIPLLKCYYNYLVIPHLTRVDVTSGSRESPEFSAEKSCCTPDGVIYFVYESGGSMGLSTYDVNTQLRHDIPIKIYDATQPFKDPFVTQMKFYSTKSNTSIVTLKIQDQKNIHVIACDVSEGNIIHQFVYEERTKKRSFGDIIFSQDSDKYIVQTVDDLTEMVQIFTMDKELVGSVVLRPKGSVRTTDGIEIVDHQDWAPYPPSRVPHTIGWFDAERIYIYSNLIRRKTMIFDINQKVVIKEFDLYCPGSLVNVFKVKTELCFAQVYSDELNLTLVSLAK